MAEPVGSYDPRLSRKKAWRETASSVASVLVPLCGALLLDESFRAAVTEAVKDNPKIAAALPAVFIALRFGIKFYQDRKKYQDPAYHLEHGVPPAKAEALAVASGLDPVEAKVETKVAVAELAAEKAKERGRSDVVVVAWLLGILGVVALTVLFAYQAGREAGFELGLFETAKRYYSDGLREGAALCAPADPAALDRCADLAACRERIAELEAEEESNVLAIDAAHERGLDEGLRLSREDWTCQRWECR